MQSSLLAGQTGQQNDKDELERRTRAGVSAPTPVCQLGYPAVIVPKSP
jgi:hypothetical protein